MLAGLGVALVVVAHPLDSGRPVAQFGSLNTFLAGILLVTIGLIGSVEIAKGQRTRRLRTALRGIALVAILLTRSSEAERRFAASMSASRKSARRRSAPVTSA
jgi:hypothetical protein